MTCRKWGRVKDHLEGNSPSQDWQDFQDPQDWKDFHDSQDWKDFHDSQDWQDWQSYYTPQNKTYQRNDQQTATAQNRRPLRTQPDNLRVSRSVPVVARISTTPPSRKKKEFCAQSKHTEKTRIQARNGAVRGTKNQGRRRTQPYRS